MREQYAEGLRQLESLACSFARKQMLELEQLIVVGEQLGRGQHTLELRCGEKKTYIEISTDEIINFSVTAQHKLIMAIMKFVPIGCPPIANI